MFQFFNFCSIFCIISSLCFGSVHHFSLFWFGSSLFSVLDQFTSLSSDQFNTFFSYESLICDYGSYVSNFQLLFNFCIISLFCFESIHHFYLFWLSSSLFSLFWINSPLSHRINSSLFWFGSVHFSFVINFFNQKSLQISLRFVKMWFSFLIRNHYKLVLICEDVVQFL